MRSTDCRRTKCGLQVSQPGVGTGGLCCEASAEPGIRMTRIGTPEYPDTGSTLPMMKEKRKLAIDGRGASVADVPTNKRPICWYCVYPEQGSSGRSGLSQALSGSNRPGPQVSGDARAGRIGRAQTGRNTV